MARSVFSGVLLSSGRSALRFVFDWKASDCLRLKNEEALLTFRTHLVVTAVVKVTSSFGTPCVKIYFRLSWALRDSC